MDIESTKEKEVDQALGIKPEDIVQEVDKQEETSDEVTVDQKSLIDALNIPVQENELRDEEENTQPLFENNTDDFDDDIDELDDNLNSGFRSDRSKDDYSDDDMDYLFDDYKLMAEMGVEILDMVMCNGAMLVANDWGNEEKYKVSDARKKKIKRPLELLLAKREKKVSPEVMFIVAVAVVYAPMYVTAFQEKKRLKDEAIKKQKEARVKQLQPMPIPKKAPKQNVSPAPDPVVVPMASAVSDEYVDRNDPADITPLVVPQDAPKPQIKRKRGRPKGTLDSKPRAKRKTSKKK